MKYDVTAKPTKGATRVLSTFTATLFKLLSEQAFEDISVNEICEESGYPRATFYNYFDDKYDLLNYFWYFITKEIKIEEYDTIPPENLITVYYDRLYDLFFNYKEEIRRIFKINAGDGYLFSSCKIYLIAQLKTIFNNTPQKKNNPVPKELMIQHCANTLLMIFEWHFCNEPDCGKERGKEMVKYLLSSL